MNTTVLIFAAASVTLLIPHYSCADHAAQDRHRCQQGALQL